MNKHYQNVKKVIRKEKPANSFSLSKYRFSPYMACEHGCLYCDGRAEKYYLEGQFEKDIVIRKNTPEILSLELPKLRERGPIAIGSGVTDVYQPIEENECIMQECANILAESQFPVSLITKSSLILRDLDLWKKVNKKNGFSLAVTLTCLDDNLRKIFEPRASSVKERLNVIKTFKENGINVGVLVLPLIPYINDSLENLTLIFDKLKKYNVDFIMPGGLTLRPGKQKTIFLDLIKNHFNNYLNDFQLLYSENKFSGAPKKYYMRYLSKIFSKINNQFSISNLAPHYVYKGKFAIYDEIYILLCHMLELYSCKGIKTTNLRKSFNYYHTWLEDKQKLFNRKRSITQEERENSFISFCKTDELLSVLNNEKLYFFIQEIVLKNKTFDYIKLKLT